MPPPAVVRQSRLADLIEASGLVSGALPPDTSLTRPQSATDPSGPATGSRRILRTGSGTACSTNDCSSGHRQRPSTAPTALRRGSSAGVQRSDPRQHFGVVQPAAAGLQQAPSMMSDGVGRPDGLSSDAPQVQHPNYEQRCRELERLVAEVRADLRQTQQQAADAAVQNATAQTEAAAQHEAAARKLHRMLKAATARVAAQAAATKARQTCKAREQELAAVRAAAQLDREQMAAERAEWLQNLERAKLSLEANAAAAAQEQRQQLQRLQSKLEESERCAKEEQSSMREELRRRGRTMLTLQQSLDAAGPPTATDEASRSSSVPGGLVVADNHHQQQQQLVAGSAEEAMTGATTIDASSVSNDLMQPDDTASPPALPAVAAAPTTSTTRPVSTKRWPQRPQTAGSSSVGRTANHNQHPHQQCTSSTDQALAAAAAALRLEQQLQQAHLQLAEER